MKISTRHRGVALVIVLGMLAVLAMLGVAFVMLQGMEGRVAANYLETVRARLLARSGVQHALSELRRLPQGDLTVCASTFSQEVSTDSGVYTFKVTDASGKLFINEGVSHYRGNDSTASRNMRRILNRLGDALTVPGLGDRVIGKRPSAGYQNIEQIKAVVSDAEYSRVSDFLTVYAWVDPNVANPVPLTAAHAQAIKKEFGIEYYRGNPPIYRFGRGKDYKGVRLAAPIQAYAAGASFRPVSLAHAVYAMDELNPVWIEITSRAPVNVNAASRAVLIALLSDLRGVFLSDRQRNNADTITHTYSQALSEGDEVGFLHETFPIAGALAARIADEIVACREKKVSGGFDYAIAPFGGPFRSWRQFNVFCDNLVARRVIEDLRRIDFQREVASQAIADVLKANFNPNLHLNELNPDRNLFLLVDKTDLLVNSTEFSFTPTGCYDIESVGRVLDPGLAEAKIIAGVRVFELIRETSQGQFAGGECSGRTAGYTTNNNRSLETGPEPDNGKGPQENGWSGYIALPTMGGNLSKIGKCKPAGELSRTPKGGCMLGETMHSHLSLDFDAHYHRDGIRQDLGSASIDGEHVENYPDPDPNALRVSGPYDPADNSGNYYRLCRSFVVSKDPPVLRARAPMDLRIDGGYLERHSGLAYWLSPRIYGGTEGVISFWVKPSFFPERSGKPRLYVDMSRRGESPDVIPFLSFWHPNRQSTSLAGHEWTHVILSWKRGRPPIDCSSSAPTPQPAFTIFVNGRLQPASMEGQIGFTDTDWTVHANGDRNSFRIGALSKIDSKGSMPNNYAADSTIDEVFFWNRSGESAARLLWRDGRYSFPKNDREGIFTSRPIIPSFSRRLPPPPSSAIAPGGSVVPPTGMSARGIQVLGISWTWFAEGSGKSPASKWAPTLTDHSSGGTLYPTVEVSLPGLPPVRDDGYSTLAGAPELPAGSAIRYRLIFRVPGAVAGKTILLATPVVDDLTLYVSDGGDFTYYSDGR